MGEEDFRNAFKVLHCISTFAYSESNLQVESKYLEI